MNKIERLITELCPEGVEWKKLKDIFSITRGRVMSKEYLTWTTDGANAGTIFYIHELSLLNSYYEQFVSNKTKMHDECRYILS